MIELKNKNDVNQDLKGSTKNFENVKRFLLYR